MDLKNLCQQLIRYGFYSLFFLVPLIMTPWNFELFEYNKMMLVYFLTVVIVGAWVSKMIANKKILLCRTPFDIPIILFLVSQILSTVFSIDVHTSIWGYYSRFHGGLLSTISYIFLYFAFVSNFEKKDLKTLLKWLLTSAFLVSFYAVLEHFGIDAQYWVQDVQARVFSTLGQPNWLSAWLAIILPLPLAFIFQNKSKNKSLTITYFLLLVTYFFALIFTKSRSGIPSALIGLAIFGFFIALMKFWETKKKFFYLSAVIVFLLLTTVVALNSNKIPGVLGNVRYVFNLQDTVNIKRQMPGDGGSLSSDIRKVVWRGAIKIFESYPVFGSGVETFAYSYYNFRPVEHNWLSEWDFLYNKAHNEYFNFLATTGAVGLGTYLLFIGWVIVWNLKNIISNKQSLMLSNREYLIIKEKNHSLINTYYLLPFTLFSGWLTILITNFFGFSVVPVALCFFLFPAFIFLLLQPDSEPKDETHEKIKPLTGSQKLELATILFITFYLLLTLIRFWYADKLYADGLKLNKQGYYAVALDSLKKASSINNGEPVYHDELGWCEANLAVLAITNKQQQLAVDFATNALAQSDLALKISPRHLNFVKTRVKIFLKLAQIDQTYYQDAFDTLKQAQTLAPTDAKISYNLGLVSYQLGRKQEALDILTKTLEMKPYYQDAQVALEALQKEVRGKISP